jgi:hypothetical protein
MAGAVIASGIVYMAVKPPAPPIVSVTATATKPAAQPVALAEPVVSSKVEPPAAPAIRVPAAPIREKPSPMPAPLRQEKPRTVARSQAPVQQPSPPPMREPANKERPYGDAKKEEPEPPQPPASSQPPILPPAPEPTPAPPVATQAEEPKAAPAAEGPAPHTVTIAAGTLVPVRIGETISSSRNQLGDSFLATLDQPLIIDGFVIAERGSRVEGRVIEANQSGRMKGAAYLAIQLVKLSTSDGQHVRIHTEPYKKEAGSSTGSDLAKIGAGAAVGAAIGAIAGGGKGAAIGAGVGGAAGAGTVLISHSRSVEIPVETRLTFKIQEPVTITEKLN